METSEQLLRLQALALVQTAELTCLYESLERLCSIVQKGHPELANMPAVFLQRRKQLVQSELLELEKTQPALAASVQQILDASCRNFPFDY